MRDNEQRRPEAEADGIIEGRNAVIEALRAGTTMDKIYLAKGETDKTLGHIASKARAQGIVVVEADRRKLDGMSRTHAHQGVIALAAVREYVTVQSLLDAAAPPHTAGWQPPPMRSGKRSSPAWGCSPENRSSPPPVGSCRRPRSR